MSFGSSSGSGSSSSGNPYAAGAEKRGKELFGQLDSTLQSFLGQIMQGLQTGGVGASIPIIQQAVSQSKAATSQAMGAENSMFSQEGAANNPAVKGIEAATGMQGAQSTAMIPSNYVMQLMSMFPSLFGSGIGSSTNLMNQNSSQSQQSSSGFNFGL
jgi:hypothetical protein